MLSNYKDHLEVLTIFLIPFGGGIPAGVILAKKKEIIWPIMMLLYFISDVILAIIFEPLMHLFIRLGKRNELIQKISEAFKLMINQTMQHYGNTSSIMALIMIAFGVDPMTGRAVAVAAGHGFIVGWSIAIAGDMIYFTLLMVSTLWLNNIIGDGTTTTFIIMVLMFVVPHYIKKIKNKFNKNN